MSDGSISDPPSPPHSGLKRPPPDDSSPQPQRIRISGSLGAAGPGKAPLIKPIARDCSRCSKFWDAVFYVSNDPGAKKGTTSCLSCRLRENVLATSNLEDKNTSLEGLEKLCHNTLYKWRANVTRFGMDLTRDNEDRVQAVVDHLAARKADELAVLATEPTSKPGNSVQKVEGSEAFEPTRDLRARPRQSLGESSNERSRQGDHYMETPTNSGIFEIPSLGLGNRHLQSQADIEEFRKNLDSQAHLALRGSASAGAKANTVPIRQHSRKETQNTSRGYFDEFEDIAIGLRRARHSLPPATLSKLEGQLKEKVPLEEARVMLSKCERAIQALNDIGF